jgi:hypothetical protein
MRRSHYQFNLFYNKRASEKTKQSNENQTNTRKQTNNQPNTMADPQVPARQSMVDVWQNLTSMQLQSVSTRGAMGTHIILQIFFGLFS